MRRTGGRPGSRRFRAVADVIGSLAPRRLGDRRTASRGGADGLRALARRGAVAPELLPDVRRGARNGATGWRRTRPNPVVVLRMLPHAVAISTHWLPFLRAAGRPPCVGARDRRRR